MKKFALVVFSLKKHDIDSAVYVEAEDKLSALETLLEQDKIDLGRCYMEHREFTEWDRDHCRFEKYDKREHKLWWWTDNQYLRGVELFPTDILAMIESTKYRDPEISMEDNRITLTPQTYFIYRLVELV